MTGHGAFDRLIENRLMSVQENGWARIDRLPTDRWELGVMVRCIAVMASWPNQIEKGRCEEPDNLVFRKRSSA